MALRAALYIALLSQFTTPASAGDTNIFQGAQPSKGDVDGYFTSELSSNLTENVVRVAEFEEALRATYLSLPKNSEGTLSHQAVRYVLHRLFVARRGWYIRGLEPNDNKTANATTIQEEWVPTYLQALLERRERELAEGGTNLHELAGLAAAFEDVASQESQQRLLASFRLHHLSLNGDSPADAVKNVILTYYVGFLLAGNFPAENADEADRKKAVFAQKYAGWLQADEWLQELEGQFLKPTDGMLNYPAAERVAVEIGQKFYEFNDRECLDLKKTMMEIESHKPGRVRLSEFYKKALYSHWRFTEQLDYLRKLGAIDETDPRSPKVITANYIMSRPNCLESSGLYAICCRDECEDLMGHLERSVRAHTAKPERIAELVAALPSDTVGAPRKLSPMLLERLNKVAAGNGGEVPLHGRLFAQWMHHVYPRECPYPHKAGSTSPQTPDEWMQQTGEADSQASPDEMWKHVESDTCVVGSKGGVHCKDETADLPWSDHEELLSSAVHQVSSSPRESTGVELQINRGLLLNGAQDADPTRLCFFAGGVTVSIFSLVGLLVFKGGAAARKSGPVILIFNAALLAFAMDFLDIKAFVFAACAGVLAIAGKIVVGALAKKSSLEAKETKCCV